MELNIAYSSDNNFIRHVYISIKSLFESQGNNNINIYLVDNSISNENKNLLNQLAESFNREITYLSFDEIERDLQGVTLWGGSLSTYARLFLARLIKKDKVLYIDGDTVVVDDLSSLFTLDISKYYMACVQDTAGPKYREEVGIDYHNKYINAGVALLNLKKWREENLEKKFLSFIHEFNGSVPCCDQGVFNGVCKGKILILPPKYNVMTPILTFSALESKRLFEIPEYYSQNEIDDAKNSPIIIHYTGGLYVRPWFKNSDHPKKDIYIKYLNESPWKDVSLTKQDIGLRTKMMKFAYFNLPFNIFIFAHRSMRMAKKLIK